ncbi:MAG: hypothetical protein Q8P31_06620 [Bacillota bacterium]|nr:hypothetical protein [Bacillota bacterium]
MSTQLGVWIAALCTIFMYSYLWRDNPLFKLGEHVFIAIGAAHAIVMGYQNIVEMAWRPMVGGKAYMVLPLVMGAILYTRFFKQVSMLSRIPIAFLVGLAAALSIRGALDASFIKQVASTMVPIKNANDLITMLGVVTTISYFFFTATARSGPLRFSAEVGRWVMMVAFGAAFGNTVMARMSLVIGRLQFLFGQWIKIL